MFSLVVKRAAAYGWSSTRFSAGTELGGQRWGHADAGGDWSQDGRVRRLAWLTGYPATGLREQHLPVLPMTRVMTDSLARVGESDFTGLTVRVPVQLAPDTRFDLVGDADWFALSAPDARTEVSVSRPGPGRHRGGTGARTGPYSAATDSSTRNRSPKARGRARAPTRVRAGRSAPWTPDAPDAEPERTTVRRSRATCPSGHPTPRPGSRRSSSTRCARSAYATPSRSRSSAAPTETGRRGRRSNIDYLTFARDLQHRHVERLGGCRPRPPRTGGRQSQGPRGGGAGA
ncbi:hypothetical protein ACRAWF_30730 [Streptomyces sp. L7]